MNREIKFRGMDVRGQWFVGNLAILPKKVEGHLDGSYISNSVGLPFAYRVRPETVGEFTGLHDRNGKEIFEGDILKTDRYLGRPGYFEDVTGKVIYQSPKFRVEWDDHCYCDLHGASEVIGNIFEHPDLREK